jgi:hypothetical protein
MRKKQQHRPAVRFAHRVMAITPLFYTEDVSFPTLAESKLHCDLGKDAQGRNRKQSGDEAADTITLKNVCCC